jgi:hypothetical protein
MWSCLLDLFFFFFFFFNSLLLSRPQKEGSAAGQQLRLAWDRCADLPPISLCAGRALVAT